MRHGDKVKKLGRTKAHRDALIKNLCRALFIHERIRTTLPKAKESRRFAERIIEIAKQNTLAARREVFRMIPDHKLVQIICGEIAPRFAERHGGYTRIFQLGPRLGDGAEMAILQLTEMSAEDVIEKRRKLIERRALPAEEGKKEKAKKEAAKKAPAEKPKKPEPKAPVAKKAPKLRKEKKAEAKKAKKEKKRKKQTKAKGKGRRKR